MLSVAHRLCGHSWLQFILLFGITDVRDCPICRNQMQAEDDACIEAVHQQDRETADYYNEKYGDEL